MSQDDKSKSPITNEFDNVSADNQDKPLDVLPDYNTSEQNLETLNDSVETTTDEKNETEDALSKIDEKTSDNLEEAESVDMSTSDEPTVTIIDNTDEVSEEAPIDPKKPKKPLSREGLSKKKKIVISAISVFLIIAITLSIALPIFFFYKDKIMVSAQEDFANVDKGTHFVLKNDVVVDGDLDLSNCNYSIDLNKHSLTVNGTLKYETSDAIDINIGTIKKSSYINGGSLIVNKLVVSAGNASFNFASNITIGESTIRVKDLTLNSVLASGNVSLKASSVIFNDTVSQTDSALNLTVDATKVVVNSKINATLTAKNSNVVVANTAEITKLVLVDDESSEIHGSTAIVNGKVTRIEGGNKVAMLSNHSCNEYVNIKVLAIQRSEGGNYKIENCEKVIYIDKLSKPVDMITYAVDGNVLCYAAIVENAANGYVFKVNNTEVNADKVTNNIANITSALISGGAGTYTISAYAVGNYNFDTLQDVTDDILYLNSDEQTDKYEYSIQLDRPTGLYFEKPAVAEIPSTETEAAIPGTPAQIISKTLVGDSVILKWNSVNFASYYSIFVDQKEVGKPNHVDAAIQEYDITEYVQGLGAHSIRIIAKSDKKEIIESKAAMSSITTYTKLGTATEVTAAYENGSLSITWNGVENGSSYKIKLNGKEIGRTNTISAEGSYAFNITINEEDILATNNVISIEAESYGYYLVGDAATATFNKTI